MIIGPKLPAAAATPKPTLIGEPPKNPKIKFLNGFKPGVGGGVEAGTASPATKSETTTAAASKSGAPSFIGTHTNIFQNFGNNSVAAAAAGGGGLLPQQREKVSFGLKTPPPPSTTTAKVECVVKSPSPIKFPDVKKHDSPLVKSSPPPPTAASPLPSQEPQQQSPKITMKIKGNKVVYNSALDASAKSSSSSSALSSSSKAPTSQSQRALSSSIKPLASLVPYEEDSSSSAEDTFKKSAASSTTKVPGKAETKYDPVGKVEKVENDCLFPFRELHKAKQEPMATKDHHPTSKDGGRSSPPPSLKPTAAAPVAATASPAGLKLPLHLHQQHIITSLDATSTTSHGSSSLLVDVDGVDALNVKTTTPGKWKVSSDDGAKSPVCGSESSHGSTNSGNSTHSEWIVRENVVTPAGKSGTVTGTVPHQWSLVDEGKERRDSGRDDDAATAKRSRAALFAERGDIGSTNRPTSGADSADFTPMTPMTTAFSSLPVSGVSRRPDDGGSPSDSGFKIRLKKAPTTTTSETSTTSSHSPADRRSNSTSKPSSGGVAEESRRREDDRRHHQHHRKRDDDDGDLVRGRGNDRRSDLLHQSSSSREGSSRHGSPSDSHNHHHHLQQPRSRQQSSSRNSSRYSSPSSGKRPAAGDSTSHHRSKHDSPRSGRDSYVSPRSSRKTSPASPPRSSRKTSPSSPQRSSKRTSPSSPQRSSKRTSPSSLPRSRSSHSPSPRLVIDESRHRDRDHTRGGGSSSGGHESASHRVDDDDDRRRKRHSSSSSDRDSSDGAVRRTAKKRKKNDLDASSSTTSQLIASSQSADSAAEDEKSSKKKKRKKDKKKKKKNKEKKKELEKYEWVEKTKESCVTKVKNNNGEKVKITEKKEHIVRHIPNATVVVVDSAANTATAADKSPTDQLHKKKAAADKYGRATSSPVKPTVDSFAAAKGTTTTTTTTTTSQSSVPTKIWDQPMFKNISKDKGEEATSSSLKNSTTTTPASGTSIESKDSVWDFLSKNRGIQGYGGKTVGSWGVAEKPGSAGNSAMMDAGRKTVDDPDNSSDEEMDMGKVKKVKKKIPPSTTSAFNAFGIKSNPFQKHYESSGNNNNNKRLSSGGGGGASHASSHSRF